MCYERTLPWTPNDPQPALIATMSKDGASSAHWHPFANMAQVAASGELVIERGSGAYVWDAAGHRYFDATASLWYCNVGHGRQSIAQAVFDQMRRLEAYSTFADFTSRATSELADRVAALAPMADPRVFFTCGGSDAIDTAAKLCRRYWNLIDKPEKTVLISRERSYHGMHAFGTSLAGIEGNRAGYGPLVEDVARVAWDSATALEDTIKALGAGRVAAFFCEPVICAGGVLAPRAGYLADVREICRRHEVLFVADEVVTGFGRVGSWFASSRWDLDPDLIVCAKGITSGYLPMGAVIASVDIAAPFFSRNILWRHGYTYSGHASASAAALANLDIIESEDLLERAGTLEHELEHALRPLAGHELVDEVRAGTGVLAAVVIAEKAIAQDESIPARVIRALRERGVLTRTIVGDAIQVSPPLVSTREDLALLADAIADSLSAVATSPVPAESIG